MSARPFLKWVGGKTWAVPYIRALLPARFGRYFEPFAGGASLLFALTPPRAVLADANPDLVACYRAVRDDVDHVVHVLGQLPYNAATFGEVRAAFNARAAPAARRAAWFIYLNRAGFNGLCRYNRRGIFNAPFAANTSPTICDADLLRACSRALQGVDLLAGDVGSTVYDAQRDDLVYLDPPYAPASTTASFVGYTGNAFGEEEHHRVASVFRALVRRGCYVLASNSDTPLARRLYAGHRIVEVQRSGTMSSNPARRSKVGEILIVGRA